MLFRKSCIIFCLLFSGCFSATESEQLPVEIPFRSNAIQLTYQADPFLNIYNGQPQALLLVVYQLADNNTFLDLATSGDGLLVLLSAKPFDSSVMSVRQYFIEPGESGNILIDRVEKTQWVGITAGYNNLDPEKSIRYYKIPIKKVKKGIPLLSRDKTEAGILNKAITLTPDSIQNNETSNAK